MRTPSASLFTAASIFEHAASSLDNGSAASSYVEAPINPKTLSTATLRFMSQSFTIAQCNRDAVRIGVQQVIGSRCRIFVAQPEVTDLSQQVIAGLLFEGHDLVVRSLGDLHLACVMVAANRDGPFIL